MSAIWGPTYYVGTTILRTAAAVRETGAENDPLITLHQLLKEVLLSSTKEMDTPQWVIVN